MFGKYTCYVRFVNHIIVWFNNVVNFARALVILIHTHTYIFHMGYCLLLTEFHLPNFLVINIGSFLFG